MLSPPFLLVICFMLLKHSLIRIIILQLYAELITKLWRMPLLSFDKIAMPIDAKDRGIGDSQQLHRYQIH
ncbi:hypothetical protein GLYMA_10G175350v4 [Glycine max]|nr:hypothetical protein GLYMA_10G175350v4 [Glycine max]KAH1138790.1 hypothetical protein GYH30_028312 [Glycine max]